MNFRAKLERAWSESNSLVCVGLDTDPEKIPEHLHRTEDAIFQFNRRIIDATADLVCAYKPQIAFYEAHGAEDQLLLTIEYLRSYHSHIPVILDAKRGDIGNTAAMYAREAFVRYGVDAVTVNPYLGGDTLEPFLAYEGRAIVVLCRTSNPGAREFQDLRVVSPQHAEAGGTKPLYRVVAERAIGEWSKKGAVLLVVGATYPDELRELRALSDDVIFLVPGVGAQGGSVEAVVEAGRSASGRGLIINASRSIIYADRSTDFDTAARRAANELRDEINRFR